MCYTFTYYREGSNELYVGSGYGNTVDEAFEDFFKWHNGQDPESSVEEIVDVELYK